MVIDDNLNFAPKPIEAVAIRLGEGSEVRIALGVIQRTAALRAYGTFGDARDWMEKISAAYVVALATRSADTVLMRLIQDDLSLAFPTSCAHCRNASIGLSLIRGRLFPTLKSLREHANALLHHLDDPNNKGVSGLNVEGVFAYCYHLFQENADALFGVIPSRDGKFPLVKCKNCRDATNRR